MMKERYPNRRGQLVQRLMDNTTRYLRQLQNIYKQYKRRDDYNIEHSAKVNALIEILKKYSNNSQGERLFIIKLDGDGVDQRQLFF
jgi:HD-GYP domain-containing protein (c-di-GMP phosphodiesterase class II)